MSGHQEEGTDWAAEPEVEESFIRPFMLTGGRTESEGGNLPVETMVRAIPDAQVVPTRSMSHLGVLRLCESAVSIAEVAALMSVPIGVARVLITDLTASGHLERFDTAVKDDVAIVRRLLDGIRAL